MVNEQTQAEADLQARFDIRRDPLDYGPVWQPGPEMYRINGTEVSKDEFHRRWAAARALAKERQPTRELSEALFEADLAQAGEQALDLLEKLVVRGELGVFYDEGRPELEDLDEAKAILKLAGRKVE